MASLTPRGYADIYKNLPVYIYTDEQAKASASGGLPPGGSWKTVDVHSYRLGLKTAYLSKQHSIEVFKSKVRPHLDSKDESITVWVKTIDGAVVSKTYKSRVALAENVNDPFYGKGSPEEVQVVLQLAVRYGVFPPEKIQIYCDNGNIGLDCNGFVGNYLRHVRQGIAWDTDARSKEAKKTEFDANTLINSMIHFNKLTKPVKKVDDIAAYTGSSYIMAIADKNGRILDHLKDAEGNVSVGHIVISEPSSYRLKPSPADFDGGKAGEPAPSLCVIESTGGMGLVESTYFILGVSKTGVFRVYRGSKQEILNFVVARVL